MKWQLKARIQNAVAALPFGSNTVYYAIQRSVGGLRPGLNHPVDRFRAAIRAVDWIESAGREISGSRLVEVGTGHMVNMPTAFWLLGAAEIVTVDLNRYLSQTLVAESNEYVRRNEKDTLALFGDRATSGDFQKRFRELLSFRGTLTDLLAMMNVRYIAPGDARALPVPENSVDFHVSNTVLEHIPADVLADILAEAKRVLKPNGLLVHHIDPSDHFSHGDDSIVPINFLKFNDDEWHRWAGNRFMYHNRLRAGDYLSIFERAGARVLRSEKRVDQPSLQALKDGLRIADRFAGLDPDELAATEISIMAQF